MNNILLNEDSLIVLVQHNDLLYNKTNKDYKNIQKKKEVWETIGKEIGATGDACCKRWASLRDKYCREVRRMACSSGSEAVTQTKWQHFESLSFLSGHMRGGRQRSNFSFEKEDTLFPPWEYLDDMEVVTASTPLPSPVSVASPLPSPVFASVGFTGSTSTSSQSQQRRHEVAHDEQSGTSSSSLSQKRRREVGHDEPTAAFVEISKSIKEFMEKDDTPADIRAHSFAKFVEGCLTGMEAKKQMKVIGDLTQVLITAQNEDIN